MHGWHVIPTGLYEHSSHLYSPRLTCFRLFTTQVIYLGSLTRMINGQRSGIQLDSTSETLQPLSTEYKSLTG